MPIRRKTPKKPGTCCPRHWFVPYGAYVYGPGTPPVVQEMILAEDDETRAKALAAAADAAERL